MPSFKVRSRLTGPLVDKDVDADSREAAVEQVVKGVPDDGSSIEITDVKEIEVQDAKATAHPAAKKEEHHGKK